MSLTKRTARRLAANALALAGAAVLGLYLFASPSAAPEREAGVTVVRQPAAAPTASPPLPATRDPAAPPAATFAPLADAAEPAHDAIPVEPPEFPSDPGAIRGREDRTGPPTGPNGGIGGTPDGIFDAPPPPPAA